MEVVGKQDGVGAPIVRNEYPVLRTRSAKLVEFLLTGPIYVKNAK